MFIERELRQELNALSKEVFGVPSRWQKLLETMELQTKEVEEEVPGENGAPPTTKKVTVARLNEHGQKYSTIKRRTPEEIKTFLLDLKSRRDAAIAEQKAKKEAQEHQKRVHEAAGGSTGV